MSALSIIISGIGMFSSGGDMGNEPKEKADAFLKQYGLLLTKAKLERELPVAAVNALKANYLFIALDTENYYYIFVDKPGMTTIMHNDLRKYGKIPLQDISGLVKNQIGDVIHGFSASIRAVENLDIQVVQQIVNGDIKDIEKKQRRQEKTRLAPEIMKEVEAFENDYPDTVLTAFIIMQFSKSKAHTEIVKVIKTTLAKYGIVGLRADDKEYSEDLFANIKTYMHCCDFGIAVFERINEDDFNPNVSIEVGYMMGDRKHVCLLKDKTLKNLPSDFVGKLYKPFDPQDITETLPNQLEKWLLDRGYIKDLKK